MHCFPKATAADETLREVESFEGVSVERRQVIYLSLGAFAALTLGLPWAVAGTSKRPNGELGWELFLERAVPMAEKLAQGLAPNEEDYLRKLSGMVERVTALPEGVLEPVGAFVSARLFNKFPFTVAQFRLAANAVIPYHDHHDYNGVLRILEGEAHIRSFEIMGPDKRPPSGSTFRIRETRADLLGPGELSTLSRARDNIHEIRARGDGVRFLDCFTFFTKLGKSTYLDVDERPRDPTQRIYEASWLV